MFIEDYQFGRMVIEGKEYTSDLMICGNQIRSCWWRKEGHSLCREDLGWVIGENPDILIIGTGKHGVMRVPGPLVQELKNQGIAIEIEKTDQAVQKYNKYSASENKLIAGAFHLTC